MNSHQSDAVAMRAAKWIALGLTAAVLFGLLIMFVEVVPFSAAIGGTKSGDPEGFDYSNAIWRGRAWVSAVTIPFLAYALTVAWSIRRSRTRVFLWASLSMLALLSVLPSMGLLLQPARSQSPIRHWHWAFLLTAIVLGIVACARLLRAHRARSKDPDPS